MEFENTTGTVIPTQCMQCNGSAKLKILRIKYDKAVAEIITIFQCKKCSINDVKTFEHIGDPEGSIEITCILSEPDDLQRYIYLSEDALISFYDTSDDKLIYEFKKFSPEITVIEMLTTFTINKIATTFGVENWDSMVDINEVSKKSSIAGTDEMGDKDIAAKNIDYLEKMRKTPNMKMVIIDPMGFSRVGPAKNHLPPDFTEKNVELFNDAKVTHVFKKY